MPCSLFCWLETESEFSEIEGQLDWNKRQEYDLKKWKALFHKEKLVMCRMSLSDRSQTKSHVLSMQILTHGTCSFSAARQRWSWNGFSHCPWKKGTALEGDIWFPRWKKIQVTLNWQGQRAPLLGKSPDKITGLFRIMINIVKWKAWLVEKMLTNKLLKENGLVKVKMIKWKKWTSYNY